MLNGSRLHEGLKRQCVAESVPAINGMVRQAACTFCNEQQLTCWQHTMQMLLPLHQQPAEHRRSHLEKVRHPGEGSPMDTRPGEDDCPSALHRC